ncbi:hypothetical protein [Achromobacter sp. SLBN-14]|uniref:hypothetical protein n=1 Tax=Achromobacter sp. SLBN-14 TaxID=2768442 RepID=UPI00114E312D|nr:hypothetical protein [Achromobacter sp. SLBN-14]
MSADVQSAGFMFTRAPSLPSILLLALAILVALVPLLGSPFHSGVTDHSDGLTHDSIISTDLGCSKASDAVGTCLASSFLDHVGEDHSHEQKYYLITSASTWEPPVAWAVSQYVRQMYWVPARQQDRPPDSELN